MDWLARSVFCCILSVSALAQSESPASSQTELGRTAWIAGALNEMQTIKVGMTRSDLLKLFTTEGGLRRPLSERTFISSARTLRLM